MNFICAQGVYNYYKTNSRVCRAAIFIASRVHVILSTYMYQLALFRSPSDLYMYLAAALPLSAMSRAAHTPASEARVVEQSLSLSNLGTGHNRIQRRTTN